MYFNPNQESDQNQTQPMIYQIRINGHLGVKWSEWFGRMSITLEENAVTVLTGPVVDQAELFGIIKKIRDLGMPLVSVNCMKRKVEEND